MSLNIVLTVGLDSWLLAAQAPAWRSAGYVVVSSDSIDEAIDLFRVGDFDLVLLGDSIPHKKRERLIFLIRSSGSGIPIACIACPSGQHACIADTMLEGESHGVLEGMDKLLAEEAGKWPAFHLTPTQLHRSGVEDNRAGSLMKA